MGKHLIPRDWKIPDTSAALSVVYYISVILISASVIACTVVGYIDYMRWKKKKFPRLFLWIGAISTSAWTKCFGGKTPDSATEAVDEEFRTNSSWPQTVAMRDMGRGTRPTITGWVNMDNEATREELPDDSGSPEDEEDDETIPAPATTKRAMRWANVIEESDTHREHQPTVGSPMGSSPMPLRSILVVKPGDARL